MTTGQIVKHAPHQGVRGAPTRSGWRMCRWAPACEEYLLIEKINHNTTTTNDNYENNNDDNSNSKVIMIIMVKQGFIWTMSAHSNVINRSNSRSAGGPQLIFVHIHQLFRILYTLFWLDAVSIYWWWCINYCRVQ